MSVWMVFGADVSTGVDRQIEVEAENEEHARQLASRAGILVESVEEKLVPPEPEPVDPEPAPSAVPTPAGSTDFSDVSIVPPMPVAYESTPVAPLVAKVPNYLPMLVLSHVLTLLAYVGYAVIAVVVVIGLMDMAAQRARNPFVTGLSPMGVLASGMWMVLPVLTLHAIGASMAALRDIARSVYRAV